MWDELLSAAMILAQHCPKPTNVPSERPEDRSSAIWLTGEEEIPYGGKLEEVPRPQDEGQFRSRAVFHQDDDTVPMQEIRPPNGHGIPGRASYVEDPRFRNEDDFLPPGTQAPA